jgi:hypothetical protein
MNHNIFIIYFTINKYHLSSMVLAKTLPQGNGLTGVKFISVNRMLLVSWNNFRTSDGGIWKHIGGII